MLLEELKNKVAVNCKTVETASNMLVAIRAAGYRPGFPDSYYFQKHQGGTCFSLHNGFAYESANFYKKLAYQVVDSSEISI